MKEQEKIKQGAERVNAGDRPEAKGAEGKSKFTKVENAHASGLGAMGRNDEKLPTGAEEDLQSNDPVY